MHGAQVTVFWTQFAHADWQFRLAATEGGLCYVDVQLRDEALSTWVDRHYPGNRLVQDETVLTPYVIQLREYLEGHRRTFELPLELRGTRFQVSVWQELLSIPFGTTTTYSAIARSIGRPKAVRAVGGAVGANPLLIIVPCHRVIGKDGSLTGFSSGMDLKEYLLALEGVRPTLWPATAATGKHHPA